MLLLCYSLIKLGNKLFHYEGDLSEPINDPQGVFENHGKPTFSNPFKTRVTTFALQLLLLIFSNIHEQIYILLLMYILFKRERIID